MSKLALPKSIRSGRSLGLLLFVSALSFFIGMLLPATVVGWLRAQLPILTRFWDGLNAHFPMLNPLHVLWYAWLAMLWWILAGRARRWPGILALLGLSIVGELLQLLVPGRNARLADVLNDGLGIGIGIGLAALLLELVRRYRGSRPNRLGPNPLARGSRDLW